MKKIKKTDKIMKYALLLKLQGMNNEKISLEILKEFNVQIHSATIRLWMLEEGVNSRHEAQIKEFANKLKQKNPGLSYRDCLLRVTRIFQIERIECDSEKMREWKEKDYPDKKYVPGKCFYCKETIESEIDVCVICKKGEEILRNMDKSYEIFISKACDFCENLGGWSGDKPVCKLNNSKEILGVKQKCPNYKKNITSNLFQQLSTQK